MWRFRALISANPLVPSAGGLGVLVPMVFASWTPLERSGICAGYLDGKLLGLGGASGSPRRHGNGVFTGPHVAMGSSSSQGSPLPSAGIGICDLIALLAAEDVPPPVVGALDLPMGVLLWIHSLFAILNSLTCLCSVCAYTG